MAAVDAPIAQLRAPVTDKESFATLHEALRTCQGFTRDDETRAALCEGGVHAALSQFLSAAWVRFKGTGQSVEVPIHAAFADASGLSEDGAGLQKVWQFVTDLQLLQALLDAVRLLRNSCVALPAAQEAACSTKAPALVCALMTSTYFEGEAGDSWIAAIRLFRRIAAQFLGNAVVGHAANQALVWETGCASDRFLRLMHENASDKVLQSRLLMVLYNTILKHADEGAVHSERLRLLTTSQVQLFGRVLNASISTEAEAKSDEGNPCVVWVQFLVIKIVESGLLRAMYTALSPGSASATTDGPLLTHEQLILLRIVESLTEAHSANTVELARPDLAFLDTLIETMLFGHTPETPAASLSDAGEASSGPASTPAGGAGSAGAGGVSTSDPSAAAAAAAEEDDDVTEIATEGAAAAAMASARAEVWERLREEGIDALLAIVGNVTSEPTPELQDYLANEVDMLDQIMRALVKFDSPVTSDGAGMTESIRTGEKAPTGAKVGLMRVLANLVHRNPDNQNRAHALGCVPVVLGGCRLDPKQPLLREWALLTVRNLCEGNAAIQADIGALKAQKVVDTPELEKLGVKPVLKPDGKVRVQVPQKRK